MKAFKISILVLILGILLAVILHFFSLRYYSTMKPEVFTSPNSKFGQFIREKCTILAEPFAPTFWASSSIMQTIVATMFRGRLKQLNYSREVLTCPDGGVISLDWFEGANNTEDQGSPNPAEPVALMFPGLVGDSQSDYLRNLVPSLRDIGYRVVSFNNRGRGGMELRTPRLYSASNIEDYELAIQHIRRKNPGSRIVAAGFSMGAMLLTRYLATLKENSEIDAAILVSANYDLVNGTKNMETGWFNKFIARIMTKSLASIILNDKEMLMRAEKPVQWDKIESATSFRELDEYFTCPMWGYPNPEAYFKDCSNNQRMKDIKIPTLCLNAADDMFSPYETLPLNVLSNSTIFVVTKKGGHLGFADGLPTVPYYGDRLVAQFFDLLKLEKSLKSFNVV